jgi:tRNA-Thr(GGU) m(6)t(6)A37 methyltransferase TsaA
MKDLVMQKRFLKADSIVGVCPSHCERLARGVRLFHRSRAERIYTLLLQNSLVILTIITFFTGGCTMPSSAGSKQIKQPQFKLYPIGKIEKEDGKTMIVLDKKFQPGLLGLDRQSYVTVVYWFDKNDTPEKRAILQVHPRGNEQLPLTGVFATHSPFRPNLIAISKCDIISIHGNVIEVEDIDAFDGSPVLDLKGDFFLFNPQHQSR